MKILPCGGALGQLPQDVKSMSKIIMTVFFRDNPGPHGEKVLPTIQR
jgi:hypothetical protein